jgi:hypothetical protein
MTRALWACALAALLALSGATGGGAAADVDVSTCGGGDCCWRGASSRARHCACAAAAARLPAERNPCAVVRCAAGPPAGACDNEALGDTDSANTAAAAASSSSSSSSLSSAATLAAASAAAPAPAPSTHATTPAALAQRGGRSAALGGAALRDARDVERGPRGVFGAAGGCPCPKIYRPVCVDGHTYPNGCIVRARAAAAYARTPWRARVGASRSRIDKMRHRADSRVALPARLRRRAARGTRWWRRAPAAACRPRPRPRSRPRPRLRLRRPRRRPRRRQRHKRHGRKRRMHITRAAQPRTPAVLSPLPRQPVTSRTQRRFTTK